MWNRQSRSFYTKRIQSELTEAVEEVAARGWGNVSPVAGSEVVSVDTSLSAIVRTSSVGISEVHDLDKLSLATQRIQYRRISPHLLGNRNSGLVGEELGRLVGNGAPGSTSVGADVDRSRSVVSGTDEDPGSGTVDSLGGLIESDERQTLKVAVVRISLSTRAEGTNGLERRDLGEGRAAVGGLPQAVAAPGTEIDDLGVLRVDGKTLAHAASGHVTTDLEGERGGLPGLALVGTAGNGTIVGVPNKTVSKLAIRKVRQGKEQYQSLVYMPAAMYTLLASAGSRASASMPHLFQLSSWAKPFASVTGVQESSSLRR